MTYAKFHIAAGLGLIALISAAHASAQTALQDSYPPAYFSPFNPTTASDMVQRIPGFSLQGGNQDQRGFGQASLNILINGRRPSSKTSGANEILRRIPASKVIRIDIKDGASLDIPGLSGQVADIITGGAGISGSWDYALRFWEGTDPQIQDGSISLSGERGDLSYVASFNSREFKLTEDGTETFSNADGTVFEDRVESLFFRQTRPTLDLNLTYAPSNGHIANVNLSGSYGNGNRGVNEVFEAVGDGGETGFSLFNGGADELEYEIGGDYALPFGPDSLEGTLKLIALHRIGDDKRNNLFRLFPENDDVFNSSFLSDNREGEYIARSEYSFKTSQAHDWQVALEGAFNFLDRDDDFSDSDTPNELTTVRVEERRAQASLTHSWAVSDVLDVQTSLGAEFSRLSVPTTDEPAREFIRPKGFISASYTASPRYTWRARLERSVGQLDFELFTDGVNLTDDFASSGNSLIVPTQSWNAEIELARQDTKSISGTVKAFVDIIEDPIDRIRFVDGSEGPGNLDSAVEYGVEANATWILDSIGLKGMRLELEGALRSSRIEDPLTALNRRLNDQEIWEYEINYRYDVPDTPYAFGFQIEQDRNSLFRRLDETFDARFSAPETRLFAEHKTLLGMTVRLEAQNLLNESIIRDRVIFDGDRTGDIIELQNFRRQRGRRISLELSDTF